MSVGNIRMPQQKEISELKTQGHPPAAGAREEGQGDTEVAAVGKSTLESIKE